MFNRDEVIAMAHETFGFNFIHGSDLQRLEAFAALCCAAQREKDAEAIDAVADKYRREHNASAENIADECAEAIRGQRE